MVFECLKNKQTNKEKTKTKIEIKRSSNRSPCDIFRYSRIVLAVAKLAFRKTVFQNVLTLLFNQDRKLDIKVLKFHINWIIVICRAELAKRVTLQVTKERVPIHVFDLLIRNFKHKTPVNTQVFKCKFMSACTLYTMTIYIALIAFFLYIKCLKKSQS